ncbi:MAG: D-glycero-beta-D-manno-heptose-7-phosphate kinase [Bacteroidia bacterium]|nr:D-glycero-beta-D-manno-heptose-7-phosphate kinase [Bacteroidia bacterium]
MSELKESIASKKVLILGDVMIDAYYWGSVNRISPEAPVPVVALEKREYRLGGAANVALNVKALGAHPILCAFVGDDEHAQTFSERLTANEMPTEGIIKLNNRKTTVKRRIIGNSHQLLRIDEESEEALTKDQKEKHLTNIKNTIEKFNVDVIIIEDYDKGAIDREVIEHVTKIAAQLNIPVTVDPKKKNFSSFNNISLFKPNLLELKEGLRFNKDVSNTDQLSSFVKPFMTSNSIKAVLITLSEKGVYYEDQNGNGIIPAHIRNIADVSGAGDTVISVASLCLSAGLEMKKIAQLSNLAGGLVCEKVGVVPIDLDQWCEEVTKHKIL